MNAAPKPKSRNPPRPPPGDDVAYADAQISTSPPLQILSTALLPDGRPAYAIELAADPGPVTTTSGLVLHAAAQADAAARSGGARCADGDRRPRLARRDGGRARWLSFARPPHPPPASSRSAPRRHPPPGCSTAAAPRPIGPMPRPCASASRRHGGRRCDLCARRQVLDEAGVTPDGPALALVEEDLGRDMALTLARHHVMYRCDPAASRSFRRNSPPSVSPTRAWPVSAPSSLKIPVPISRSRRWRRAPP